MNRYRALEEWSWLGEGEVLEESLSYCHFMQNKSHLYWPGVEHGSPCKKRGDKPPEETRKFHQYSRSSVGNLNQFLPNTKRKTTLSMVHFGAGNRPPVSCCVPSHCTHWTISALDQTESLRCNPIKPSVYAGSSLSLVLYLATVVLAKQKRPQHW
jgi:hypothetical protein